MSIEKLQSQIDSAEKFLGELTAQLSQARSALFYPPNNIAESRAHQQRMGQIEQQQQNMLGNIYRWKKQITHMKDVGQNGLYIQGVPTELGILMHGVGAAPLQNVAAGTR